MELEVNYRATFWKNIVARHQTRIEILYHRNLVKSDFGQFYTIVDYLLN